MKKEGLSKAAKWAYGFCLMGGNFVYMITAAYTLTFYNVYFGISSAFVGTILMIARVFDAVNDPLTGVIVAKVNFKSGKFRPWLISGALINGLVLFALFAVPEAVASSNGRLMVWCAVVYLLWSITYDIFDIPIWSIIPAVTKEGRDRESMATLGRTFAAIGCGLISILTMTVVPLLGGGDTYANYIIGFKWFALIIAVYYVISTLIFNRTIKGKDKRTAQEEKTVTIREMLRALFANNQTMATVISIALCNFCMYFTSNLIIYFYQFDVGGTDWNSQYTLFNSGLFAFQVLGMVVMYPLFRAIFRRRKRVFAATVISAVFGYCLLCVFMFLGYTNVYMLFIPAFFIGISASMQNILTTVFLADSVDYGDVVNGHRDESVIFSMQTFVVKLASGLSAGLAGYVITWIGLNTQEGAVNSESTIMALRLIMACVPVLGLVLAVIYFARRFHLTEEKMSEISAALTARNAIGDGTAEVAEAAETAASVEVAENEEAAEQDSAE